MAFFTDVFKALADGTRLRIMRVLLEAQKPLCVCELVDSLDEKQYNVSGHLKELKVAGLVEEQRDGRFVFYKVVDEKGAGFIRNLFKAVLSIPKENFTTDIKRMKKRLSLRVKGKVVITMNGRRKA